MLPTPCNNKVSIHRQNKSISLSKNNIKYNFPTAISKHAKSNQNEINKINKKLIPFLPSFEISFFFCLCSSNFFFYRFLVFDVHHLNYCKEKKNINLRALDLCGIISKKKAISAIKQTIFDIFENLITSRL